MPCYCNDIKTLEEDINQLDLIDEYLGRLKIRNHALIKIRLSIIGNQTKTLCSPDNLSQLVQHIKEQNDDVDDLVGEMKQSSKLKRIQIVQQLAIMKISDALWHQQELEREKKEKEKKEKASASVR